MSMHSLSTSQPCLPFPGVRFWVVTSPVVPQREGAVPNMDFLLFPRSFPRPEPAGDSVDRPEFPHIRRTQRRAVINNKQTDYRHYNDHGRVLSHFLICICFSKRGSCSSGSQCQRNYSHPENKSMWF